MGAPMRTPEQEHDLQEESISYRGTLFLSLLLGLLIVVTWALSFWAFVLRT
ncbi:MAG: hypothetical protein C0P68_005575 [Bacillota bacterium]